MNDPANKNGADAAASFSAALRAAEQATAGDALPPVHQWNPDYCGDIDMRIGRDGQWFYAGSPIGRARLVRLFSTILRRDPDDAYYLVTPVEKIIVHVDDVPFIAVAMDVQGEGQQQILTFTSNVGDRVVLGAEHPLRFEIDAATQEPAPYLHIRDRLEARINRAVFYDLVELAEEHAGGFGIWSAGLFFPMMALDDLRAQAGGD